jgi:signal transduction histidine kinase
MRLAVFILANVEPILAEWETFARSIWPDPNADTAALRDHAQQILRATAADMMTAQTAEQQSDKSKGEGDAGTASANLNGASDVHAVGRAVSGFDLLSVVAEYRALRASVLRLWRERMPVADQNDSDDVTRFNESIDQSLTKAVRSYSEHVDRARQLFLAVLGHDLRTPLNAMRLSADLLLRKSELPAESSRMVERISASAVVMGQMISDLLDFTTTGLGAAIPLSLATMNIEHLSREVLDEIQAAHPTRTLRLHANGDLVGEWDAARLRQVLSNLIGNALQHGSATDPVDLTITGERADVSIAVRNEGPGIPATELRTIFEPLLRLPSSERETQRRAGSVGLGLYIVREIVTAHGGSIDVTSSAEAGTVFTVRLPRQRANR